MESFLLIFSFPNKSGSRFYPVPFEKNLSLVDKLERAYFSKGFM